MNNVVPISKDVDVDVLKNNATVVSQFMYRFRNDESKARRSVTEQVADMMMNNVRELRASGAWQHYRNGLGEFEWREHEFDYFLASQMIEPIEYARVIRNGSIPAWAELVNMANPGTGKKGSSRRPVEEVADQIRRGIPGGHGDPDVWVKAARAGFGDRNERKVAADPKRVKAAVKVGSVTAVSRPPAVRVMIAQSRNESLSVDEQRARMIVAYLEANPGVSHVVRKTLG